MRKLSLRLKVFVLVVTLLATFSSGYFLAQAVTSVTVPVYLQDLPSAYSYVIKTDGSNYWAVKSDGSIPYSSTNATYVILSVINTLIVVGNGGVLIKDGTYVFTGDCNSNTNINAKIAIEGESRDGVILNFNAASNPGPYASDAILNLNVGTVFLSKITVKNAHYNSIGIGGAVESQNNVVEHIKFVTCDSYGVVFRDGSGSKVDDIIGDCPFNIVSFWNGNQSNISIKNVFMQPSKNSYTPEPDDTISFNPDVDEVVQNVYIENVVGDYSLYFDDGGTANAIAGVLDFAGFDGQSYRNIHAKHIIGIKACAICAGGYDTRSFTDSVFQDIHSSYAYPAGSTGGGLKWGIQFSPNQLNYTVTFSNLVFKDIYIDHAYAAGMLIVTSGGVSDTGYLVSLVHISISDIYLWDNAQGETGIYGAGLIVGNGDSEITNTLANSTLIKNIYAYDDQGSPTQTMPISVWNWGSSNPVCVNINGGAFHGNIDDVINESGGGTKTVNHTDIIGYP